MHKTDISVAEEFELKDVAEEKDTSMKGFEFGKETKLEKDFTKALLVATEEKEVLVHEAEISVIEGF